MSYLQAGPSITAMFSSVSRRLEQKGKPDRIITADASVFASRIATASSHFNKRTRTIEWDRYAARLSGPSSTAPDPDRNQVFIPWPALKLPKTPARESQMWYHLVKQLLTHSATLGCFGGRSQAAGPSRQFATTRPSPIQCCRGAARHHPFFVPCTASVRPVILRYVYRFFG